MGRNEDTSKSHRPLAEIARSAPAFPRPPAPLTFHQPPAAPPTPTHPPAGRLRAAGPRGAPSSALKRAVSAYTPPPGSVPAVLDGAPGSAPPPASGSVATAIAYAEAQIGKPYCWAGQGPSCFDCSGLVFTAYAAAGIHLARTTYQWRQDGPQIPLSQIQPGDLLFSAGSDGTSFSGSPGCDIKINPSVCPAQMADPGPSVNAAGVVDAGLSRWQKCAAARVILFAASQLGKP